MNPCFFQNKSGSRNTNIKKILEDILGILVITIISCMTAAIPTLLVFKKIESELPVADSTIYQIVLYLIITFITTGLLTNGMFIIYRKITWLKADIKALHIAIKIIDYMLSFLLTVLFTTVLGVLPLIYDYYKVYVSTDEVFLFTLKIKYSGVMYFCLSIAAILKLCLQREIKIIESSKKS